MKKKTSDETKTKLSGNKTAEKSVFPVQQIEFLMKCMKENNVRFLRYEGLEIEVNHSLPSTPTRTLLKPLPVKGDVEEVAKKTPKKEPTDDVLLLDPYAGL